VRILFKYVENTAASV